MTRLAEAVTAALDGHQSWLRVGLGRRERPEWVRATDLGRSDDLGWLFEAATKPSRPPQTVAYRVATRVSWALLTPQVLMLSRQRRLPDLDMGKVWMRRSAQWPAEVAWEGRGLIGLPGDALAGEDGFRKVASLEVLYGMLISRAVDVMDPVIEAIRSRTRVGRPGLWGTVVESFAEVGPHIADEDPRQGIGELQAFTDASRGTPLGRKVPVIWLKDPDGDRAQVGRPSCCLFYKEQPEPGVEMPEWLAGPWERYCTTCPLIPEEETARRLHRRLEEQRKERT